MYELRYWVESNWFLATAAVAAVIAIITWNVGWLQGRKRSWECFAALAGSSPGRVVAERGPGAAGFVAGIQPAPPPYVRCTVTYQDAGLMGWVRSKQARGRKLEVRGALVQRPRAELVWNRGVLPPKALGSQPGRAAWVQQRLDFANVVYATRGADTQALRHAFRELHTRFGTSLQAVMVRADAEQDVVVTLRARWMDLHDLPALMTMVQAIGRAARGAA